MKVILTGATGFIGGACLQRLLAVPAITSVVVLSRREVPVKDAKLKTVIVKDFLRYEPNVLEQIADAEAAIWVLGTPTSGKEVHDDMTVAGMKAFAQHVVPNLKRGTEFRYVYTSGAAVVRDQDASVWIAAGARKLRGVVESKVVDFESQNAGQWKSYIVRPAMVTNGVKTFAFLLGGFWIPKEELSAAMVDLAVNGGDRQTLSNADLRKRGQAALNNK